LESRVSLAGGENRAVSLLTKRARLDCEIQSGRNRFHYFDGELCAVRPDGMTSFSGLQAHTETAADLVYFAFDLLHLDGENLGGLPLLNRKLC
jgi:ATP-dependent DNA ligase